MGHADTYATDPKRPYGPVWGDKRPPGLPAYARFCSTSAAGKKALLAYCEQAKTAPHLILVLLNLARGESGCMLGRPANNFDARPKAERVDENGRRPKLITAWGLFNWNYPCQQEEVRDGRMPWDLSEEEELAIPIRKYTKLWADILAAGGNSLDAARGVRLWHALPVQHKRYIRRAKTEGFSASWAKVPNPYRARIDHHLAGIDFGAASAPASTFEADKITNIGGDK